MEERRSRDIRYRTREVVAQFKRRRDDERSEGGSDGVPIFGRIGKGA